MPESPSKVPSTLRRLSVLFGWSLLGFAFLFWLAMPPPHSPDRDRVSRVRADMRSMATALESYRVDNAAFPPLALLHRLTTPIAYINSLPHDVFATEPATLLRYQRRGDGWIIGSFGPDRDQATGGDLHWDRSIDLYDPEGLDPKAKLIPFTYDPTNGLKSQGDIWRIHEPPVSQGAFTYDPTNGMVGTGDLIGARQ